MIMHITQANMKNIISPLSKEAYRSPELEVLDWSIEEAILQSSPGSFDNEENYGDDWN